MNHPTHTPHNSLGHLGEQPMPLLSAFGAAMRRRRFDKAMSLAALASKTGLHSNYLGSVERGERNPSLASIWCIASGLEITVAQLFDEIPTSGTGPNPEPARKIKKAKKAPVLRLIHSPTSLD